VSEHDTIFLQPQGQWLFFVNSATTFIAPEPESPSRPAVQEIAPPGADAVDVLHMRRFCFEIRRVTDNGDLLVIETLVEDRNGQGRMPLTFSLRISHALQGRARALRIRRLVLWAMMHELDEVLSYADGTPIVDPHPEHRDYRSGGVHPAVQRMSREADKHERKAEIGGRA